jgi:hypothetical protein
VCRPSRFTRDPRQASPARVGMARAGVACLGERVTLVIYGQNVGSMPALYRIPCGTRQLAQAPRTVRASPRTETDRRARRDRASTPSCSTAVQGDLVRRITPQFHRIKANERAHEVDRDPLHSRSCARTKSTTTVHKGDHYHAQRRSLPCPKATTTVPKGDHYRAQRRSLPRTKARSRSQSRHRGRLVE